MVVADRSLTTLRSQQTCHHSASESFQSRPAVCHDAPTVLDILARITPPLPEIHVLRPPINLGIVLDRSGSMSSGRKMSHAREAARFAVGQMLPTDRLSLTIFDDVVETIVPSAPVVDKPSLAAKIDRSRPEEARPCTAAGLPGLNKCSSTSSGRA